MERNDQLNFKVGISLKEEKKCWRDWVYYCGIINNHCCGPSAQVYKSMDMFRNLSSIYSIFTATSDFTGNEAEKGITL
ncbi:unnamed protein product [Allacma fusca]|uniref:Uncharacterized protein n=1 Tax=Allacma fusca TaxID=39272 RepID=A0A8J2LE95_9HEXA|nr:unnamed protein product [Allacma fusca]